VDSGFGVAGFAASAPDVKPRKISIKGESAVFDMIE
jgi:hypothetical protein